MTRIVLVPSDSDTDLMQLTRLAGPSSDLHWQLPGAADDVFFQRAVSHITSRGNGEIVLYSGTAKFSSPVTNASAQRVSVKGLGRSASVIQSSVANGAAFHCSGQGGFDFSGISIDCLNTTGAIGILIEQSPQHLIWGDVEIKRAPDAALRVVASDADSNTFTAWNNFGRLRITNCGKGVHLQTVGAGQINSCEFDFLYVANCTTALHEDDDVNSLTIKHFDCENNTTGILVDGGSNEGLFVLGGHFEGNTTDLNIANNPDFLGGLVVLATTDKSSHTYTYSNNRADMFVRKPGGLEIDLKGRWGFDNLTFLGVANGGIFDAVMHGMRLQDVGYTDGDTTPSVANANIVFINYSSPTTITDFDNETNGQVIIVVANNANVSINDGGNFNLVGGNWVPTAQGDNLMLVYEPNLNIWLELSRQVT